MIFIAIKGYRIVRINLKRLVLLQA